ncbi:MAG TPA: pyrroline-5-carboxylate reductase, partial [Acidimicrobiales bacterium]|nr:pyrroline-5-carboxylate reductase [Acidimicrobiales bacterium]
MPVALALIGGGRMGEALLRGLLTAGWSAAEVAVVEVSAERAAELRAAHPGLAVAAEAPAADAAVVAVKPGDVPDACRAATAGGAKRLLSIAAGVPIARLEESAGPGVAVLRAMPNTAALVGQAASALAAGPSAGPADEEWAAGVLGAVGRVVRVPERLMDAVTGLSGSGPAYVFLVAEALIDGGVAAGLPRDASVQLTVQTLLGAARLLAETGDTPEALRAMVTSPGGTTAAGLRVLESRVVRAAFIDAVAAA